MFSNIFYNCDKCDRFIFHGMPGLLSNGRVSNDQMKMLVSKCSTPFPIFVCHWGDFTGIKIEFRSLDYLRVTPRSLWGTTIESDTDGKRTELSAECSWFQHVCWRRIMNVLRGDYNRVLAPQTRELAPLLFSFSTWFFWFIP